MFSSNTSGPGAVSDPQFNYVTMLLPGNGTNGAQNNTFLDSSTNNFTITRNGNVTQGSFSPYGDRWSNYFDGSGDWLTVASNAAFAFGTGDFTVEVWIQGTNFAFTFDDGSNDNIGIWSQFPTSGFNGPTVYVPGAGNIASGLSTTVWTHVAIARQSGTMRVFFNGTLASSFANSQNWGNQSIWIGSSTGGAVPFTGYISNLRIVKGTAVYTAAFTPPTAPLTAITNTSLLTCQSNRFRDASTNNFTITRNGDVSVQRFSPFNPTAPYAAATIGGSGYFSGATDYLDSQTSSAFAIGTTGTYECWAYATSWGGNRRLISQNNSGSSAFEIYVESDGKISISGGANSTAAGAFPLGQWVHIAVVYNSGNLSLYVNGVSVSLSGTTTGRNISDTSPILISALRQTGSVLTGFNWVGYISNVRVVKGTAVYTANFTPPTAPVTAITNTSLLLNFTNGGIIDNAMMNDLETVGNAQISTSVSKFGGGSLAFDGSGDALRALTTPNLIFGSGNVTIEAWVYLNTTSGSQVIIDTRASSAGSELFNFQFQSGVLYVYAGAYSLATELIAGTSAISATTWTHVAFVRSSGTNRLFVNGTQQSSNTNAWTQVLNSGTLTSVGMVATSTANPMNGYIDDLRITKGVARYTANFTPPTAPLPIN